MKLYKCTKNIFGFEKRIRKFCCLPSDEGSGLKYSLHGSRIGADRLPSDEGSGLKWVTHTQDLLNQCLPSDEGSGLKSIGHSCLFAGYLSSLG